jgi:hypothetical protein
LSRVCRFGSSSFPLPHSKSPKCTRQPEFWTDVHSGDFFFLYPEICEPTKSEPGRGTVFANCTRHGRVQFARHGKRLKLTDLTDSD